MLTRVKLLYKNPENSFPKEYDSEGNPLPKPKSVKFLKLFDDTLTKFSIFRTSIGVYKQVSGLAMGSCLSSILSNLFVHLMEESVIPRLKKQVIS